MVTGPVLVPVLVNIPAIAHLFTATTTNIVPANPSTSVPDDHSTTVDPEPVPTTTTTTITSAPLPRTTTVPANPPTPVVTEPEPTITTTIPSNPTTPVVP